MGVMTGRLGPRSQTSWVTALGAAIVISSAPAARAEESVESQSTAPDSAVESTAPVDQALSAPQVEAPVLIKKPSEVVKDAPQVIRDAHFKLNLRAYTFDRETASGRRDAANALGGEVFLETGRLADILQVGLSYYTSNLVGSSENPGLTGLVAPNGDNLNVLGQAYLRLGKPGGWQASLYRQGLKVPYLDTEDSRMIPRTQEAYLVYRLEEQRAFGAGHLTRTKRKDSEDFIPMSAAAGALGTDKGVSVVGGKLDIGHDATVGVFNLYGWDTYNTLYAEGGWSSYFLRNLGTKVGVQYTDQRSVGDGLVGDFRTWQAGIKWSGSVKSAVLTLAYTQIGEGGSIRFPWGGFPSYNWGMIQDFDRPGERAWRLGVSVNGSAWGHDAWSGFVNLTRGYHAQDPVTGTEASDLTEAAFTIDFKPESGSIKGLWLRFRAGQARFDDGGSITNFRFILNYSLPLL